MRRVLAGVLAGVLVGTAALAQSPDVERAKELYGVARKALDDGRHTDAIRDFGAAYDITKDPALFYWIGSANEKAGKCDVALIYYGRYLKEAKPTEELLVTVRERIRACGGNPDAPPPPPPPPPTAGSAVAPVEPPPPVEPGSAVEPAATGSGSAAPLAGRHQGPWLLVGGSIAMLTIGVVLAYAADASENDVNDLYVGLEGNPPVFDKRTKDRYDALVAEGEKYEKLSWASFAVAAGLAGGAAIWFYLSRDGGERAVVAPTVQKDGAGVSATVRW